MWDEIDEEWRPFFFAFAGTESGGERGGGATDRFFFLCKMVFWVRERRKKEHGKKGGKGKKSAIARGGVGPMSLMDCLFLCFQRNTEIRHIFIYNDPDTATNERRGCVVTGGLI